MSDPKSKSYKAQQKIAAHAKAVEMTKLRKDIDAMVALVRGIRANLDRVPSELERLVAAFNQSTQQLSFNYDLRDPERTTSQILSTVTRTSKAANQELSSAMRAIFDKHTFAFLNGWIGMDLNCIFLWTPGCGVGGGCCLCWNS